MLVDVAAPALERARVRIAEYVDKGRQRGKLTDAQVAGFASGITFTSNLGPFAEGSITWGLTATDARNRTATTIHHLVAVDAC